MMLKKSISLLLCAVLAFSLCTFALPETALAVANSGVWVGGTEVTSGGYWLNDGNGGIVKATSADYNVHYATATKVLTLKDANITKTYLANTKAYTALPFAAILASVSSGLTIVLEGTNSVTGQNSTGSTHTAGIYVLNGSLTITGSGSLTATGGNASSTNAESYGIFADDNINISSGNVTAIGGAGSSLSKSYGVYSGANLTISTGSTLAATGGTANSSSYGAFASNTIDISGGTVNAIGGTTSNVSYGLCADSGDVNISGGNVTATGGSAIYISHGTFASNTIVISGGTVNLTGGTTNTASYGAFTLNGIDISGGTVTATGSSANDGNGYGLYTNIGDIVISGGTVNATGGTVNAADNPHGSYYGMCAQSSNIHISGGKVTATGAVHCSISYGLQAANIRISGGMVTATGSTSDVYASWGISGSIYISGGTVTAKSWGFAFNKAPTITDDYPTPSTITVSTDITGASPSPEYIPASIGTYLYFRIAPQYPLSIGGLHMTATATQTSYYINGEHNGTSYVLGTVTTLGKTDAEPTDWNAKLELENNEYVLTLNGLMLTAASGIKSHFSLKLLLDANSAGSNIVSSGSVPAIDVNGDLDLLTTSTTGSGSRTLEVSGTDADAVKATGNLTLDGKSILNATTNAQDCSAINVGQNLTVGEECQLTGRANLLGVGTSYGVKAGGNVVMNGSSLTCHSTSDTGLEAGGSIALNSGYIDLNGSDKALNKEPDLGRHPQYVWQAETNPFALAPYIYSDTHKRLVIAAVPSATIGDVTVGGTVGSAISTTTAIAITLKDDTFNNSLSANDDISGWFKNIPDGISAKLNAEPQSDKAWVVFYGTPTTSSTAPMTVTISADVLNKGLPIIVTPNANAKWNISTPPSAGSSGGGSSAVTVYNDPSRPNATVWLTGNGLTSGDLLVTERDPNGSAYKALLKLANGDDVFNTYNIYLRSGKKSTGSAMNLTFDLDSKYAGQAFTLVHQKADGSYEYFYDTADYFGDLSFGPLYELSPFMLVRGKLAQMAYVNTTDLPKTGDSAQVAIVTSAALLLAAASLAGVALRKRHD